MASRSPAYAALCEGAKLPPLVVVVYQSGVRIGLIYYFIEDHVTSCSFVEQRVHQPPPSGSAPSSSGGAARAECGDSRIPGVVGAAAFFLFARRNRIGRGEVPSTVPGTIPWMSWVFSTFALEPRQAGAGYPAARRA